MNKNITLQSTFLLLALLFTTNLFAQTSCDLAQPMMNGQQYTGNLADFTEFASFSFLVSANSTPGSTITITLSSNQDPLFQIKRYLDGHCSSNFVIDYQGNISFGFSPTGVIPEFNSPLTLTVTPGQLYILEIDNNTGSPEDYSIQIDYNPADITVEDPLAPPTVPDEFSEANLWFKADAGVTTGATFTWENQADPSAPNPVTGDADVSQSTANNQPTYNTSGADQINFNPSITFDGTDDFLQSGAISNFLGVDGSDKVASQFVVYKRLDSDDDNGEHIYNIRNTFILLGGKTNGRQIQESFRQDVLTRPKPNETLILDLLATTSSTFANNQFSMNKNGIENQAPFFTGSHVPGNSGVMRFGEYLNDYGNFVIAEVVVFPKRISLSLKREIQSYLAIKYGISLGDNEKASIYLNSSGLAVYVSNVYKYDVFGIAKDDGAGLNQTQSNSMNTGSGDGTGQSGKGNIVLSNPSSLDDGDYLLIGHDNGSLIQQSTEAPSDLSYNQRVGREWFVKQTGNVGTIDLTFDITGLSLTGNANTDFILLVDTDNDFTTGATATVSTSITGTKVLFDDISLPDGSYFTFVTDDIGKIWTGAVDTTWDNTGNWSDGAVPTSADDALIRTTTANNLDITVDAQVNNLFIAPANEVSVSSNAISISGNLTNDGTLVFKSDANGSGQFGPFTGNIFGTGNVMAQRYMSANRAFRLVSSAVTTTDFISNNWQQNTHITGAQGTVGETSAEGFDTTQTGNPSMFTFDNSNGGPDSNSQDDDYNAIPNTNATNLEAGKPYVLFVRGDRTIDLSSNTASSATTLSATGSFITGSNTQTLSSVSDYFSLVANPYQAIVDFTALTFTGIANENFMYIYDPATKDYVQLNSAVPADVPNMFIKPGQSFFVVNQNLANAATTVQFDQADINTSGAPTTTVFSDSPLTLLKLELFDDSNISRENLRISFIDNAQNGIDSFDGPKLAGGTEIMATFNSGKLYSFERRNTIQDTDNLPLYLENYQDTNYEFRINLENWDANVEIFVQDNYLNTTTPITPDQAYAFSVDSSIPESIAEDRFSIVFDNTTLSTTDYAFGYNFSLYPNPTQGQFSIKTPNLSGNVQVEINNLLGQQVFAQNLSITAQEVFVNTEDLASGIYVVKLTQKGQSFSAKLMVE